MTRRRSVIIVLALLAFAGCGDADEPQPAPTVTVSLPQTSSTSTTPSTPAPEPDGTGPAETATTDPRTNALERSAARTVRDYVDAVNARDGAAVCDLLVPGSIDAMKLPIERGSCAASLDASIGYRNPRGIPWEHTEILKLRKVEIANGATGTVVAAIRTDFADRDQPSFEDDIVYLARDGDRWLIAKPSSTLYRAVGIADVPVAVLSPPD